MKYVLNKNLFLDHGISEFKGLGSLNPVVLNWGGFVLQGTFINVWRPFGFHNLLRGCYSYLAVQVRDSAKHPTVHRPSSHSKTSVFPQYLQWIGSRTAVDSQPWIENTVFSIIVYSVEFMDVKLGVQRANCIYEKKNMFKGQLYFEKLSEF